MDSLAGNKQTVTAWRTATQEVAAPLVDGIESDGLSSLRTMLDSYNEKAEYLKSLLWATNTTKLASTVAFYQRAARAIENLLPEFELADIPF